MYNLFSMLRRRFPGPGLLGVFACAVLLAACSDTAQTSGQKKSARPAIPVHVSTAMPEKVKVYSKFPGRIHGKRSVHVVARVEGVLDARHYNEGEIVHKGDLLYTIDAREFKAVVAQRKAQLASAQASLNQAQRNWQRVKRLYEANAVSEAKRDQALSKLEKAQAAVQLAKANLESAQIDLDYATVEAPITGVTSLRDVDVGALVQTGTRLTTITHLNPVYVLFALPVDDALARRKAFEHMGEASTETTRRKVKIILPGGQTYPIKGTVDFAQSTIDPETGTVQLRAVVDNPKHALMPGLFVRARLRIATLQDAVVVPDKAVGSSQKRPFVYVASHGKAVKKPVELGPKVEGGQVIASGLSQGDRVIVSGLGQLRPGMPIKVKNGDKSGSSSEGGGKAAKSASLGSKPVGDNPAEAAVAARGRPAANAAHSAGRIA